MGLILIHDNDTNTQSIFDGKINYDKQFISYRERRIRTSSLLPPIVLAEK